MFATMNIWLRRAAVMFDIEIIKLENFNLFDNYR